MLVVNQEHEERGATSVCLSPFLMRRWPDSDFIDTVEPQSIYDQGALHE